MRANEDGTIWKLLRLYGYSKYRLREGISLCKVFWSLVIGLPFALWGRWIAGEKGHWWVLRALTIPLVMSAASWIVGLRQGYNYLWPFLIAAGLLLAAAASMAIIVLWHLVEEARRGSEFISLLSAGYGAAKSRACPVIRFGTPPRPPDEEQLNREAAGFDPPWGYPDPGPSFRPEDYD